MIYSSLLGLKIWIQLLALKSITVELILDRCITQASAFVSKHFIWSHVGQRGVIKSPTLRTLFLSMCHLSTFLPFMSWLMCNWWVFFFIKLNAKEQHLPHVHPFVHPINWIELNLCLLVIFYHKSSQLGLKLIAPHWKKTSSPLKHAMLFIKGPLLISLIVSMMDKPLACEPN